MTLTGMAARHEDDVVPDSVHSGIQKQSHKPPCRNFIVMPGGARAPGRGWQTIQRWLFCYAGAGYTRHLAAELAHASGPDTREDRPDHGLAQRRSARPPQAAVVAADAGTLPAGRAAPGILRGGGPAAAATTGGFRTAPAEHPSGVSLLVLDTLFPTTLHEDILQAVGINLDLPVRPRRPRDPEFRARILRAYEYRCTVCGFDVRMGAAPIALEAAHIL